MDDAGKLAVEKKKNQVRPSPETTHGLTFQIGEREHRHSHNYTFTIRGEDVPVHFSDFWIEDFLSIKAMRGKIGRRFNGLIAQK